MATEFTPLTELQEEKIKDGNKIRQDLTKILEHHCPDSAFVKLMNLKAPSEAPATLIIPKAPLTLARSVSCIDELLRDMTLSESQMQAISEVTQQQSGSADWKEQRVGRCTSSKSKRIFTRVKTIMQKPETDVTCLVKEIMCYNVPTQTRAMKHGLALEPVAKVKFCQVMKRKHKGFRQQDTGLHVCQEKPFIAASPDLLCQCTCHGNTICEVKCPMLFDDITPETYPHLVRKPDNTTTLSTTSEYYFQMQHIMGVTGCQMAYLFVYTPKTYFLESVQFNEDLWNEMMKRFDFFWREYVAPEMLNQSNALLENSEASKDPLSMHNYCKSKEDSAKSVVSLAPVQKHALPYSAPKPNLQHSKLPNLYLCAICGDVLPENPQTPQEESVQCDECSTWYHMSCTGESETQFAGQWKCFSCT